MLEESDLQVYIHYGVPPTASIIAFDPIQGLLAIGTLDGRIKIFGGNNIEGILVSPKRSPYKFVEFLQNKGVLIGISSENVIQAWNLDSRHLCSCLDWESTTITAFSVINCSNFMYIGDEHGMVSVVKYEESIQRLLKFPYRILGVPTVEAAECSISANEPVVEILVQPHSSGNRVLLAYQCGLLALWDIFEDRIIHVKGDKNPQLKFGILSNGMSNSIQSDAAPLIEEKEISAVCWTSYDSSIVSVGYIDGDILLWDLLSVDSYGIPESESISDVVKLQLSDAERRLPVIVLHWLQNDSSHNRNNGRLFVYGGDEIGSDEKLTILNLEWSRLETLRCVGHVNMNLIGSFADMLLLPTAKDPESSDVPVFILTNPGKVQFYDYSSLNALMTQPENSNIAAHEFRPVVPTDNPTVTMVKLSSLPPGRKLTDFLTQAPSSKGHCGKHNLLEHIKWPLTGGVLCQTFTSVDEIEKLLMAGYEDGSVRIWNANHAVLQPVSVLEGKVEGVELCGLDSPVTALDFFYLSSCLAVGNDCGLVRVYNLDAGPDEKTFHIVTETKHDVHHLHMNGGICCSAVLCSVNSPVKSVQFVCSGVNLAIGYACCKVAMFEIRSFSLLYFLDGAPGSLTSMISMVWQTFIGQSNLFKGLVPSGFDTPSDVEVSIIFILTKDASLIVNIGSSGDTICCDVGQEEMTAAISIHVIDSMFPEDILTKIDPMEENTQATTKPKGSHFITNTNNSARRLVDTLLLICFVHCVCLYDIKSLIQGKNKVIKKMKLAKTCSWTGMLRKDGLDLGLLLLYDDGELEIRNLPGCTLVKHSSLMSVLRWNFKPQMEQKICCSESGELALVNGCEVAVISVLSTEISCVPEILPCLHDKALAAAGLDFLSLKKPKKLGTSAFIGGIVKSIKGKKSMTANSGFSHLESIFSSSQYSDSTGSTKNIEIPELDIDDIVIDEPEPIASASSHIIEDDTRVKDSRKERMSHGGNVDRKPRMRTPQEIIATYRKAGDTSSVAAHARDKLLERQEKLERMNQRSEELRSGAEDFASMADELARTMERRRKWWKI